MRKIVNLLGWSVRQIIAGIIGLIGVLVAALYAITLMCVFAYFWTAHKAYSACKCKAYKRKLNKLYTEFSQSLNSLAIRVRGLRF